ncbi:MAG: glucosyl-3-phosphoglycerate synthase, partial [Desulfobacterales bacterium]|nr:glucosyl-3-phosphoglycerate synthase [Desulfobacterales bacterium]
NQDTKALGRMSFSIMKTFLKRIEKHGKIEIKEEIFNQMIQYNLIGDEYDPDFYKIDGIERPPMIEIETYRDKFHSKLLEI